MTLRERNRVRSTTRANALEQKRRSLVLDLKKKKNSDGLNKMSDSLCGARNVISNALTILQISLSRESRDLIITDKRGAELGQPESFGYMISPRIRIKESSFHSESLQSELSTRATVISSLRFAPDIFEILRAEIMKSHVIYSINRRSFDVSRRRHRRRC